MHTVVVLVHRVLLEYSCTLGCLGCCFFLGGRGGHIRSAAGGRGGAIGLRQVWTLPLWCFLMGRLLFSSSPFKSGPALASRLCKAAMLSRFNLVAQEAQRPELLAAVSYREAKVLVHRNCVFERA